MSAVCLLVLFILGLQGCGLEPPRAPEPCSKEELVVIQADFLAQVKVACEKGKPLAECQAYPKIKAERDARVTRWIACSP